MGYIIFKHKREKWPTLIIVKIFYLRISNINIWYLVLFSQLKDIVENTQSARWKPHSKGEQNKLQIMKSPVINEAWNKRAAANYQTAILHVYTDQIPEGPSQMKLN
jgi:hypothetical protein